MRAARDLLVNGPMRFAALAAALEERGFPMAAAKALAFWMDLVRVPPSGTWDARRADLYGLAEWWSAFGPAPMRDIASWVGVTVGQMKHAVDRMDLVTQRDAVGKPLLDLPEASIPDPETPAPPRFIGVWEAMLLVHARRTQVLPEELRPLIFNTKTPHSHNTFLLDGQVAGTWRFDDGEIQLSPMRPLAAAERAELEQEAHRLAVLHR